MRTTESLMEKNLGVKWYSKVELSVIQLIDAINFFYVGNFVSSITLAGASEEILGKLLNNLGLDNTLDKLTSKYESKTLEKLDISEKEYIKWMSYHLNYHRNHLKHLNNLPPKESPFESIKNQNNSEIPISSYPAKDIILRAINNYHLLQLPEIEVFEKFKILNEGMK